MAAANAQLGQPYSGVVGDSSWTRFLDGGLQGISKAVVTEGGHKVKLSWADGHQSEFSLKWLRDHSNASFNVNTKQREGDTFLIPNDTPVTHASVETLSSMPSSAADPSMGAVKTPQQVLRLRWNADGNEEEDEECTVPIARLRQHCSSETARSLRRRFGTSTDVAHPNSTPVLWGEGVFSSATGKSPPSFEYKDIMEDDQQPLPASSSSSSQTAASRLLGVLKSHGIALVRGSPANVAGTEALGRKIGGHLMGTYYGKESWSVSTETVDTDYSCRDAAYTTKAIGLHTDCVFLAEPPGIQVFNCEVPASEGGASFYADGFAVAERLRLEHPEAFEFFTKTSITYQTYDAGYHYVTDGPIFRMGPHGVVDQVRHNDIHRAPLDYLSTDDIDRFYEYHKSLSAIIRDPTMVARIDLKPGDTVIFDNHRALHARDSFKDEDFAGDGVTAIGEITFVVNLAHTLGWRRMVGCYIGMDEANSKARIKGV